MKLKYKISSESVEWDSSYSMRKAGRREEHDGADSYFFAILRTHLRMGGVIPLLFSRTFIAWSLI